MYTCLFKYSIHVLILIISIIVCPFAALSFCSIVIIIINDIIIIYYYNTIIFYDLCILHFKRIVASQGCLVRYISLRVKETCRT